jgi:hypothetical protein
MAQFLPNRGHLLEVLAQFKHKVKNAMPCDQEILEEKILEGSRYIFI